MLKYIFVFLFLCTHLFCEETKAYKTLENQAQIPSLNPEFKMRKSIKIELENGLQAYLVSDPEAPQSAAALTVLTGSWSNPDEYPGLAHFLEHMLFLGTKKYPIESDYDHFLAEQGGTSNAFTGSDFTGYLFGVNNAGFVEALDRFSSFFVEPLFNPSGVGRELNAIDQEYSLNTNNEARRQSQIFKELGNPKHPFYRFDIGNSSTLSKVSQETLKEWFKNHYSANLMRLFVYSNLPLEELKDLVIQDFSPIPNKNLPRPEFTEPLLRTDLNGHIVYIEPNQNVRTLNIMWEIPSHFAKMRESKPEEIICYIIGHQGPESLLAELKRENLAEELFCNGALVSNNALFFEIEVSLTAKGLTQVETVIDRCFQAIKNLQQKTIPDYLVEDVQRIALLRYQYQPREDAFEMAMKNGIWLAREGISTYPELTLTLKKKDLKATQEFLSFLTPEHAQFALSASQKDLKVNFDKKEQWMGVRYAVEPMPKEKLKRFSEIEPIPEIDLPKPNPFIPSKINLVSTNTIPQKQFLEAPHPAKIVDSSSMLGYFAPDLVYQTPKAYMRFTVKTPSINNGSPQAAVMTELFIKAFEDQIDPLTYDAKMADVDFQVEKRLEGLEFTIYGFSESILNFLKIVGPKIALTEVSPEKFEIYKDVLEREYNNLSKEHPLLLASDFMKGVVYENYTTTPRKIEALSNIDLKKFQVFLSKLFNKTFIEALITGNITQDQALVAMNQFQADLGSKPFPVDEQIPIKVIELPNDKGPYYIKSESEARGNAALLAIEADSFSPQARNIQQMLGQAIKQAFFTELRTRQQTGYAVQSMSEDLEKHLFTLFAVQSNSHEPAELLYRFEQFIEDYVQNLTLVEIPENRFELLRSWLLTELKTPPKNLKLMGERLNLLAFHYRDFNWTAQRIADLEKLTYDEFVDFIQQFLGRSNKRRLGVLIEGQTPNEERFRYTPYTLAKLRAAIRSQLAAK